MSSAMQSARGASAFTSSGPCWSSSGIGDAQVFSKSNGDAASLWTQLIDELLCIRQLEDDWDGEGTKAPPPSLVDGAILLAQDLEAQGHPPADRVIATVNGTVSFEWLTPLGYCDIEVISPNEAEYSWVPKGSRVAQILRLTRRPQ